MDIFELFFLLALFLIFFTYFGYPCILFLLSLFYENKVIRGDIYPKVIIIIPVYNEENSIRAKVENCLNFDYPQEKLEIVVVSDNSDDQTDSIVESFGNEQVKLIRLPFRGGKVAAQNYAVVRTDADVYLFTDVAINTNPESIKLIVQNFNDDKVGVVSCRDVIIGETQTKDGENQYIQYDMMVRGFLSKIGSLIGVTGGFYAVRRKIAKGGWNPAFPPDFYVALRCIKMGLRVIEDSRVEAYYKTASREWDELPRKVRTINRGMHALFSVSNRKMLNPFRYGIISFKLFCHKVLRWLTPFFLAILFISNIALINHSWIYVIFLLGQLAFYIFILLCVFLKKIFPDNSSAKLGAYFFITNLALLKSWFEVFLNRRYVSWKPTKR